MQVVYILLGIFIGAFVTYLIVSGQFAKRKRDTESKLLETDQQRLILNDRLNQSASLLKSVEDELKKHRDNVVDLTGLLAGQKTNNQNLQEKLENQKKELEEIQKRFTTEFENLSAKILEEKSQKFTEQNRTNLEVILNPLREKIKEFEQKVDQSYKLEAAERNSLKGEIKSLIELNKQISDDANNLSKALKGDAKKQGNWGEVILERILERSGLTRGSEYDMQVSMANEDGKRIQPDVIIYLPDQKHLIIDSKVSLLAYDKLSNSTTEEEKSLFLKEHLTSIYNHIKNLSDKNYPGAPELSTLDFVLLFMPIEPSFGIAVQNDAELFNYAWDRKIVIVSPSTLLATLRTISSIWKHEKQNKNVMEIAKIGGTLYDKFVNFLGDMNKIGEKLRSAQQNHEDAMNKLSSGSGNIIRKMEEMKKLGAKATKDLPQDLLEKAAENDAIQNF